MAAARCYSDASLAQRPHDWGRRSDPGRRTRRRRPDEIGDVRPRLRQAVARKPEGGRLPLPGPDPWDIANGLADPAAHAPADRGEASFGSELGTNLQGDESAGAHPGE